MKKLILSLILSYTLSFGATYEDGRAAQDMGDYETAFTIFNNLADQGDDKAQGNLGGMYYSGQGVKQDYKKAFEWYEKSANQGNKFGQAMLGRMYYNGEGGK